MKSIYVLLTLSLVVAAPGCGDDGNPLAPGARNTPPEPIAGLAVLQGPVLNAANGHYYYRLQNSTWSDAEKNAVRMLGGHLVTIDDAAENSFVMNTFANIAGRVWTGLNDAATEGTFVFSSGAPLGYSNWEPGEPNNRNDEDFVAMYSENGRWVDVQDLANPPGIGRVYGVVETEAPATVFVIQGPVTNPANGHTYYRLSNSNWSDAEAFASGVLGGHLATIDDAAENTFVRSTFADAPGSGRVWIGLNDAATEGTFVYASGAPFVYSNWEPGEPNNANDEDYVAMYSGNGRWVDVRNLSSPGIGRVYGVVEVE